MKNTPVRAGMAGGSADAAAVLVGMNELYGAHLSMSELCALGAKIGADVPFALMGGTCRVQGVGDFLKALPPVPECWFTVVMPDYGVSTPGRPLRPTTGWAAASTRTAERRKPLSVPEIWMPFVPPPAMRWKSAAEQRIPGPSRPCCGSMALSPP